MYIYPCVKYCQANQNMGLPIAVCGTSWEMWMLSHPRLWDRALWKGLRLLAAELSAPRRLWAQVSSLFTSSSSLLLGARCTRPPHKNHYFLPPLSLCCCWPVPLFHLSSFNGLSKPFLFSATVSWNCQFKSPCASGCFTEYLATLAIA
jgi:hypothetical protein